MIRNNVAADIIVNLRACLGSGCVYNVFQSRGMPPAECDSVALIWGDTRTLRGNDCGGLECDIVRSHSLLLMLTKCCVGIDAQAEWDSSLEHEESRCFYNDIELIECCIMAGDFRQIVNDHGLESISISYTRFDPVTSGGCMSAYITVNIVESVCC